MNMTRRQLRKLIAEAMYDPQVAFDNKLQSLEPEFRAHIQSLIDAGNIEQAHSLVDTLTDYDGPGGSFDSYQDIQDQKQMFRDSTKVRILDYLPNFDKIPDMYQNAMIDYILEHTNQTMHLEVDDDEVLQYMKNIATNNKYEIHEDIRKNPSKYPPSLFYIYTLTEGEGFDDTNNPFSKIDPHGQEHSYSGFHDGFRKAYERIGRSSSNPTTGYDVEHAVIQMLRDFLPEIREVIIN